MNKLEAYSKLEQQSSRLIFLRHAATDLNSNEFLQGARIDKGLNEFGVKQAREAGQYIQKLYKPDLIISSPMKRTLETLEAAGLSDTPIQKEARFMELDFGDLDGTPIMSSLGQLIAGWAKDPSSKMANGESLQELYDRVSSACEELLPKKSTGKTILICTHSTPIKAAMAWALGGGADMILQMHTYLASISIVAGTRFGRVILAYNLSLTGKYSHTQSLASHKPILPTS